MASQEQQDLDMARSLWARFKEDRYVGDEPMAIMRLIAGIQIALREARSEAPHG